MVLTTLHYCNLCTELGRVANVREFLLTALYGAAGNGDIGWLVQLCAPFAPRKGLHVETLHAHSFLIICTLHLCNLCTELGLVANVRELPLTALYGAARNGDIGRPVQLCAPFAPRKGLHF